MGALAFRDAHVVDPAVARVDVDDGECCPLRLGEVDGAGLEPFPPRGFGEDTAWETLPIEVEGRLQVVRGARADGHARRAGLDRAMVGRSDAKDGARRPLLLEPRALEQEPAAQVARADGRDEPLGAAILRPFDRRFQEQGAELAAAELGRDEGPEEVGMLPAGGHLDASEGNHGAVVLLDEQRFLRIHLPVGEFTVELVTRLPQRVSDLFRRPLESAAGELEYRWAVVRSEATQAAGHGKGEVRSQSSRPRRST